MKELTIEEKAALYDKAIERAKNFIENGDERERTIAESIFAGIMEKYKDEKIRRALIRFHKSTIDIDGIKGEDIIAWLEKQINLMKALQISNAKIGELIEENYYLKEQLEKHGEQKSVPDWMPKFLDELRSKKNYFDWDEHRDIEGGILAIIKWMNPNYFNEKDGKQKADKVEPKFHQGEWITNGDYTWKIIEVKPLDYILQSQDGNIVDDTTSHVDEQFHSFTIEDAKDGDVLVNQNGEMPFIFKECKDNHIYCYCGYTNHKDIFFDRFIDSEGEELYWSNLYHEQVYPATKEQRDLLFKKMHEAGYEWDAEKKELKKIKEEVNGEDYGIDSLYHAQRILEKTLGKVDGYQSDDGILEHKCAITAVKKLYKQKSVEWSWMDRQHLSSIIKMVEHCSFSSIGGITKEAAVDWLKFLKDRIVQPK